MGSFKAILCLIKAVFSNQHKNIVEKAVLQELVEVKNAVNKHYDFSKPSSTASLQSVVPSQTAQHAPSTSSSHSTFSAGFYSHASSERSIPIAQTGTRRTHPQIDINVFLALAHGVSSVSYNFNDLEPLRTVITVFDLHYYGNAFFPGFEQDTHDMEDEIDASILAGTWTQIPFYERIGYLYAIKHLGPYGPALLALTSMLVTAEGVIMTYIAPGTSTSITVVSNTFMETLDKVGDHLDELDKPLYLIRIAEKLQEKSERARLAAKARNSRFPPGLPIPDEFADEYDEHDDDGNTIYGDVISPDSELSIFYKSANTTQESADFTNGSNTSDTSLSTKASSVSRASTQEFVNKAVSLHASNEAAVNIPVTSVAAPTWTTISDAPIVTPPVLNECVKPPVILLPTANMACKTEAKTAKPTGIRGTFHKVREMLTVACK